MIVAVVAAFCLAACTESVDNAEKVDRLPQIYPDYIGVTIPAGIAPLDFNVEEQGTMKVDVTIRGSHSGELHTQGEWAEFDIKEWYDLTMDNAGGKLTVDVCAKDDEGKWRQYRSFDIHVSPFPLEDFGLTYRHIQPGYEVGGNIGIYQRDIHSFDEFPLMTETALPGCCYNCPDFTKVKVDFDIRVAREEIQSGKRKKVKIKE